MNEVAVTTAVTAAYDGLRSDRFVDGVDYLFYCDQASAHLARGRWQTRPLSSSSGAHPRRIAKLPKLDPHSFPELRRYRFVIWIDGGIHIRRRRFVDDLLTYVRDGMAISPHFDGRDDAYSEATIRPPKYANEPLDEQVAHYRAEGYPGNDGLYECGVIAREMAHPMVARLGALWQAEVDRFSYQDQVSLPYCLWRLDYRPGVLPRSFRDMNWIKVNGHRRDHE